MFRRVCFNSFSKTTTVARGTTTAAAAVAARETVKTSLVSPVVAVGGVGGRGIGGSRWISHETITQKEFGKSAQLFYDVVSKRGNQLLIPFVEASGLKSNDRQQVLDIACGPGITTIALAKKNNQGKTIGLDLTKEMLHIGEKNAFEQEKLSKNTIEFVQGNVEQIPFKDQTFDLVCSRAGFHHFTNAQKVMEEMYRVTKKNGGRIIIQDIISKSDGENGTPDDRARELHNAIQKLRDPSHHQSLTEKEMTEGLKKAGFKTVEIIHGFTEDKTIELWISQTGSKDERSPLETLLKELCDLKVDTCMKLRYNEKGGLVFSHNYRIWKATK